MHRLASFGVTVLLLFALTACGNTPPSTPTSVQRRAVAGATSDDEASLAQFEPTARPTGVAISTTSPAPPRAPSPTPIIPLGYVTKTANLRAYPSTKSGKVIETIPVETELLIISRLPDGSWYEVESLVPAPVRGYMSASLVTVSNEVLAVVPVNDVGPPPVVVQPPVRPTPKPKPPAEKNCDPSYPDFCLAVGIGDLDCGDIPYRRFTVIGADPHRFDGDNDGIGCER